MRTLALVLAAVALFAGCQDKEPPRPGAAMVTCDVQWTPGFEITRDQAVGDCEGPNGKPFTPTVKHCDPARHDGTKVDLVLGPNSHYAVFPAGAKTSTVDAGDGVGGSGDVQTAAEQEIACAG